MVCFDIGETLVDETEVWGSWADRLAMPRLTFFAALGAVIERGGGHLEVFDVVAPGFDVRAALDEPDAPGTFDASDLYPDAVPAIAELAARGYRLAIAGNQPREAGRALAGAGLPVEFVATSEAWRVEKPSRAFFERLLAEAGLDAPQVAYVGDRVDNDVVPAAEAGLVSVFIRRGPWGYLHASKLEAGRAAFRIDSLLELPDALDRWNATAPGAPGTMS
jgi:HAD superfamily hydrolase (TIGR01549 family)